MSPTPVYVHEAPPASARDAAQWAALWQRLMAWQPDPLGQPRGLSERVQADNGWTPAQARAALREYRRFVFLLWLRDGRACPSDAVDQVWHAHLLDSRAYFTQFCPEVLGRTLHHVPGTGGEDAAHQRATYAQTLADYAREFGEAPPAAWWPTPAKRFAQTWQRRAVPAWCVVWRRGVAAARQGVNRSRAWALRGGLAGAGALLLAGCAHYLGPAIWPAVPGPVFWPLMAVVLAALLGGQWALRRWPRPEVHDRVDPETLAYVAEGRRHAVRTALLELMRSGRLRHDADPDAEAGWTTRPLPEHARLSPLARSLHAAAPQVRLNADWERAGASALDGLAWRAQNAGWLRTHADEGRPERSPLERLARGLTWVALIVGVLRVWQGLAHGRPVAFLVLVLLAAAVAQWALAKPPRWGVAGHALLTEAKRSCRKTVRRKSTEDLGLAFALYGAAVLSPALMSEYGAAMLLPPHTLSRTGNGGGCSGGGSGGGGGSGDGGGSSGCGGCGGGGD